MPIGITVTDNADDDSPGVDIAITGLSGYETVLVQRIDNGGVYDTVGVRGLDTVPASATMAATDFEAPINRSIKYQVTGSDSDPDIEFFGVGGDSAGTTSVSPSYPAGSLAGDLHIMSVAIKPYTATVATPSGWTLLNNYTSGTTASGPDTGSTREYIFTREGAFSGSETVTGTSTNTMVAHIATFRKGSAAAWVVSSTSGADDSPGTTYSATSTSFTPIKGDFLVVMTGFNTDAGNAVDQVGTLTATNISFLTTSVLKNSWSTIGDDICLHSIAAKVATVTAADTPTWSTSGPSNVAGVSAFVRLSTTASQSETVISSNITLTRAGFGRAWLKSVSQPALSREIGISEWPKTDFPTRILGNYKILGRVHPIVLTDAWGTRNGTIKIMTDDNRIPCVFEDLNLLVIQGQTLMLQTADYAATNQKDLYFEVESYDVERLSKIQSNGKNVYVHTLSFIEVDMPSTLEESLGLRSYQDVIDENATYQDLLDNYAGIGNSYLTVLNRAP